MFLQMNKILFRWAPLPGWIRSWPRSREREVGWRGRGPSSLRGRQGREQDDDYYVEDHDDDDVLLIAQHPDWPRSGRLSASPRCKERSRWRRQPARSSSERRLWNLCLTKYDSFYSPLKHDNKVGNMVYLVCRDYHSYHLLLNNNNENYLLIMYRFEGINHNFTKKLYEWENRWRRFDINLT